MARGSNLISFLKEGLENNSYTTLWYSDETNSTAIVKLPRASASLNRLDQKLVKDWDILKGRKYFGTSSYSKARQRLRQAIKKTDLLEKLSTSNNAIEFRFIIAAEPTDDSASDSVPSPSESYSSGYYSGSDMFEDEPELIPRAEILQSIFHDHPLLTCPVEVIEEMPEDESADVKGTSDEPLSMNYSEETDEISLVPSIDFESFAAFEREELQPVDFSTLNDNPRLRNADVVEVQEPSRAFNAGEIQGPSGAYSAGEVQEPSGSRCAGAFKQEEFQLIDFSTLNDYSLLRNADVVEVQEPSRVFSAGELQEPSGAFNAGESQEPSGAFNAGESQEPSGAYSAGKVEEPSGSLWAGGFCPVWMGIKVSQIGIWRLLFLEEKVFEVNSPPNWKDFIWNSGNINYIIDQKMQEELGAYKATEVKRIGKHLLICYKPKF